MLYHCRAYLCQVNMFITYSFVPACCLELLSQLTTSTWRKQFSKVTHLAFTVTCKNLLFNRLCPYLQSYYTHWASTTTYRSGGGGLMLKGLYQLHSPISLRTLFTFPTQSTCSLTNGVSVTASKAIYTHLIAMALIFLSH